MSLVKSGSRSPATVEAPKPARAPAPKIETVPVWGQLADGGLGFAFLALTFLLGAFPNKDTDIWWHLRTGDWIRENLRVPIEDLYTFGAEGHRWIDLHWGFQVALSWVYGHGGIVGANLAKCVVTTLAVGLLLWTSRRGGPLWVAVLAWLPALLILGGRMYVRPETLTLFWMAGFIAVLTRWHESPRLAYALPVLQFGWVNTQGLFIFGPILLGAAWLDALMRPGALAPARRRWWRTISTASALTLGACILNPYGLLGALYPLELFRTMNSPLFSRTIAELTPIPKLIKDFGFDGLPGGLGPDALYLVTRFPEFPLTLQLHLGVIVLGALSFLIPLGWWTRAAWSDWRSSREVEELAPPKGKGKKKKKAKVSLPAWRPSVFWLTLFLMFSYLSWQATRNSHQFAAVVGTLTAANLAAWVGAMRARSKADWGTIDMVGRVAAGVVVVGLFAGVASGAYYRAAGEGRTVGLGEEPLWHAHDAARVAGQADPQGRTVAFHLGHAALFEYLHGPEKKTYADARLEVMGPELYERYLNLTRKLAVGGADRTPELEALGRPVVLTDHVNHADVAGGMMSTPGWRCVWFDPIASVYAHESKASLPAVDFGARHFRHDPNGPVGVPALLASAKAVGNCVTSLWERGLSSQVRPLSTWGLGHARRALEADPSSADGWVRLGLLEISRDPSMAVGGPPKPGSTRLEFDIVRDLGMVRASFALRQALERSAADYYALSTLSTLDELRGMNDSALELTERLAVLRPISLRQSENLARQPARISSLRAAMGSEPTGGRNNRAEIDEAIRARLALGRVADAAERIEREYPAAARTWDQADLLARIRLHQGRPDLARVAWASVAQPPRTAERTAWLAVCDLVEGRFDAARRGFREALEADPNLFPAWYGLAVLEQDAGRADAAYTAADRADRTAAEPRHQNAARVIRDWVAPYRAESPPKPSQPQPR